MRPGLADATKGYRELRINLIRTHDFFGPADIDAKWSDPDPISKSVKADGANSIFPDWNADPSPPPDFDKYANIVRHVVMHYNNGWAHGFHDRIRYWEIWNEPNLKRSVNPNFVREFWSGTPQQFYALFEKVARALKSCDPSLKVGGPAIAFGATPGPYREGLLDYCVKHNVPLDFFSWHHDSHRSGDPHDFVRIGRQIRALLDAKGFSKVESHISEWGMGAAVDPKLQTTMETAAFVASAAIYMQDAPIDRALYYRGDTGSMGLFDRNANYRRKAYGFRAVGAMQDTPLRLAASGADAQGFAVLAGRSKDGSTVQVLLSNYEIAESMRKGRHYENNRGYELKVTNLPWGEGEFTVKRYRTTATENWVETETSGKGGSLELSNQLEPSAVELIVIRRK